MLSLLLACAPAAPPKDEPAALTEADPRGLDGCTYELMRESVSSDVPWTCTGGFDGAGNDLGRACLTATGRRNDAFTEWDTAGCAVGAHWYDDFEDGGSYEWIAEMRCDEHANEVWMSDRQVQLDTDGTAVFDESREITTVNTYDGDLLVSATTTYSTGSIHEKLYTWSAEGWLAQARYRYNGGEWTVVTYTRDEDGNATYIASGDEGAEPEHETSYTYDTLGREVTSEVEGRGTEYDFLRTRTYEGDTIRYVQDDYVYDDGDVATDTWTWSCP